MQCWNGFRLQEQAQFKVSPGFAGAPKNPFEAAAGKSSKLSKTGVCTEVPHTALQVDGVATCKLQPTIFTYLRYDTYLVIYNYMIKVFSSVFRGHQLQYQIHKFKLIYFNNLVNHHPRSG